jgi:hypothetical protein
MRERQSFENHPIPVLQPFLLFSALRIVACRGRNLFSSFLLFIRRYSSERFTTVPHLFRYRVAAVSLDRLPFIGKTSLTFVGCACLQRPEPLQYRFCKGEPFRYRRTIACSLQIFGTFQSGLLLTFSSGFLTFRNKFRKIDLQ